MNNKLITESLKEGDGFSSNIHAIDTVAVDVNTQGIKHYNIPQRYYENKIVLLPVNKTKYFFYWEFSPEFIKNNKAAIEDIFFHIVDEKHNLLESIQCQGELGQYFFEIKSDVKLLEIIARYKHGVQLKHLLASNKATVFNSEIKIPQSDVWINKQKGFTEVIRSSLQHFTLGMSSKNYVDEISRLKEFEKISKGSFSSSDLGGQL